MDTIETIETIDTLRVTTPAEWRGWLVAHADTDSEVWLVLPHKNAQVPGPTYDEAVRQALCFGWIDSHHRKHDEHSSRLRFSPRRARSSWSALNRSRVADLVAAGQMTERGQAAIDLARARGTWQPS